MKKFVSFLLVISILFVVVNPAMASSIPVDNSAEIKDLLDRRAECVCLEEWGEVALIEQQLANLGVEKLTPAEVEEQFVNNTASDEVQTRVAIPISNNVSWFSTRDPWKYGNQTFEVQTLIVQPNQNNSNLKLTGNRSISSEYKWAAGAMNFLTVIGSEVAGKIPGASVALTVFDSASGFITGISRTTEIDAVSILYSYSHVTTASFKYVKLQGQPDNMQRLTYISTKGVTAVGYQYPEFKYDGIEVEPGVVQGTRTIYSVPAGYDSNFNAVKAYNDVHANTSAYVMSVEITGIESKVVSDISPVCPQFLAHIT